MALAKFRKIIKGGISPKDVRSKQLNSKNKLKESPKNNGN